MAQDGLNHISGVGRLLIRVSWFFQCMTSLAGEIEFMVGSHGFKSRKRKQNPHAAFLNHKLVSYLLMFHRPGK